MDFSSLNPVTTNGLNLAARRNQVETVARLLKKLNPNCIDNRGWTCLHEAAANDSYESLLLILKQSDCRPLSESHEGHTALYLACRQNCSIPTIKALLNSEQDIVNYGSTEGATPLHLTSTRGNLETMQLLIDYGAMMDVQDFDGDTPLHDAAVAGRHDAVELLLHAGANPEIMNDVGYTPFHLACFKGSFKCVAALQPFVTDINQPTQKGDSPLMLAVQGEDVDVIQFLLKNGANPHIVNGYSETALTIALNFGYSSIFKLLLEKTDMERINREIVLNACKPHYFKFEILEAILNHDFGPEFFDFFEAYHVQLERIGEFYPRYLRNPPLNSFLNVSEYIFNRSVEKFQEFFLLFMMRGVSVNALDITECPPLVFIHYCPHNGCFADVFELLIEFNCNVDHCTAIICNRDSCIPDAFIASLTSNPVTSAVMFPYSLYCEPGHFLTFSYNSGVLGRIPLVVQNQLMSMIDNNLIYEGATAESLNCHVFSLKHLSRLKIRSAIKNTGKRKTTKEFIQIINNMTLPLCIKNYLRYL